MRRPVSRLTKIGYVLEAIPIYFAFAVLRAVPVTIASAFAGHFARLVGPATPMSRRARRNLDRVYADLSAAEKRRIVREMWDNLGRLFAETTRIRALWDRTILEEARKIGMKRMIEMARAGTPITLRGKRIEIVGVQNFVRLLVHRGPAIIFTGHFGNWELLPVGAANFGVYTSVVFRTPNNPHVAALVQRMREGLVRLLPKGAEGAVAAGRTLMEGGRLGLLADQKQNRGIAVPFFGEPAMTGTTLAKLVLRFRCPAYGAWVERTGGRRFRIHITPAIEYQVTGDDDADVYAITSKVNEAIEGWVRQRPGQWLWLHRRWPNK